MSDVTAEERRILVGAGPTIVGTCRCKNKWPDYCDGCIEIGRWLLLIIRGAR